MKRRALFGRIGASAAAAVTSVGVGASELATRLMFRPEIGFWINWWEKQQENGSVYHVLRQTPVVVWGGYWPR